MKIDDFDPKLDNIYYVKHYGYICLPLISPQGALGALFKSSCVTQFA
jgi:hypothetical protein